MPAVPILCLLISACRLRRWAHLRCSEADSRVSVGLLMRMLAWEFDSRAFARGHEWEWRADSRNFLERFCWSTLPSCFKFRVTLLRSSCESCAFCFIFHTLAVLIAFHAWLFAKTFLSLFYRWALLSTLGPCAHVTCFALQRARKQIRSAGHFLYAKSLSEITSMPITIAREACLNVLICGKHIASPANIFGKREALQFYILASLIVLICGVVAS